MYFAQKKKCSIYTVNDLAHLTSNFSLPASIIAVTGPMAAGKNYICSQLEHHGWDSVDADKLVHKAIEIARNKIIDTFEPYAREKKIKLNKEDGSIDRRALGELLFSMPDLLEVQENIVYPIITVMIEQFIAEHPKTIINATVLYKTPDLLKKCQAILFVDAPVLTRLKRAHERDNLPYLQIFRRFYNQRNLLKQYKKSDVPLFIIKNL